MLHSSFEATGMEHSAKTIFVLFCVLQNCVSNVKTVVNSNLEQLLTACFLKNEVPSYIKIKSYR